MLREISQAEYDRLTKKPSKPASLMPKDHHKAIMDEIVRRLSRRPIRFDVVYDGVRIKSVVPIYGDDNG